MFSPVTCWLMLYRVIRSWTTFAMNRTARPTDNVDQPFREKLQRVYQGIQKSFHWDLLPATVDYCRYTAMLSGETDSLRYASKGVLSHLEMDANRIWS